MDLFFKVMPSAIKLNVGAVLKHILELEPKLFGEDEHEDDEGEHENEELGPQDDGVVSAAGASLGDFESILRQQSALEAARKRKLEALKGAKKPSLSKDKAKTKEASFDITKDDLLDLNGPKLIIGMRNWIFFYKVVGQVNWSGKPLYISIIYKLFVVYFVLNRVFTRFVVKVTDLHIVNENYKNPIFLFIASLTAITLVAHVLVTMRTNLLDLCPLYKIITTPRLCFVKEEVLHVFGTDSLTPAVIFYVYHGTTFSMMFSKNLEEFITDFRIVDLVLDIFCSIVTTYWIIGLAHCDLYIRLAFGHWLLALKSHLEQRFTLLHKHQRRKQRLVAKLALSQQQQGQSNNNSSMRRNSAGLTEADMKNSSARNGVLAAQSNNHEHQKHHKPLRMFTFDEIQTSLNNMDDHLEVLRTVQAGSMVLLTLEVFLINGMVFLITYHLLADQKNFYHGFLFLSNSVDFILIFFSYYFGDSWLYYALSAFVQTVEDEYFMQSDIKLGGSTSTGNQQQQQWPPQNRGSQLSTSSSIEREQSPEPAELQAQQQMLLISKKDVLFCREFLHQFENHLATSWSNLTFKSHLHTLRTFVTLIAAQIIFDHEH